MSVSDLQRGAEKRRRQDKRAAINRVVTYKRWLERGSRLRDIPTIPTNADWGQARLAGKVK